MVATAGRRTPGDAGTSRRRSPPDYRSLDAIVRRFLRDDDVVDVALAHACGRRPKQLRLALQRRNRSAAGVAHARADATHELMNHRGHAAFVRDTAFDTFRDEFFGAVAGFQ